MGNSASCSPCMARGIKVAFRDGRVEEYRRPLKAAELMLDNPRHFVCDSGSLRVGCRVPGLSADEELEPRRLYLLLPMDMLFSVLTNEEMSYLLSHRTISSENNGAASTAHIARIFPVLGEFCLFPSEGKPAKEAESSTERFGKQRSWQPALDTILETPSRLHRSE
ncbi:hypothetical protein H6P81_009021 [Aristolochia fimbriata]|uniref:Uncharacterized protein n=1 Tax=Aristolochia fimbriata TaxID=158543 RepID=A0AAV7EMW2_ARIFI|nr:hypothetical protein H6P81_009021 [Aristolochia fimbriata]